MLPKLVWLKIFSYLNLTDKNSLSQTCWELHWHFQSPCLWRNLTFLWQLGDSSRKIPNEENPEILKLYKKYICFLNVFGHAVKNLKIHIHGDSGKIDSMMMTLLNEISKRCEAVENLTIDVSTPKRYLDKSPLGYNNLVENLRYMIHTRKLNALNIHACPQECLKAPRRINDPSLWHNLHTLNFFHLQVVPDKWIWIDDFSQYLWDEIKMADLTNLRILKLHCSLITSTFLKTSSFSGAPSGRANNLKEFHIMLMGGKETKSFYEIPLETWRIFFQNHQSINLHVTLANTIPEPQLFSFLNSTTLPLITSLTIASYVRYPVNFYTHLCNINSSRNLTSLCDYTTTSSVLINLLPFLNTFSSIDCFTYNGEMYNKEIMELVSSRVWKQFNINLDKVLINYYEDEDLLDAGMEDVFVAPPSEDQVLFRDPLGEYRACSLYDPNKGFFTTDRSQKFREKSIKKMVHMMDEKLKCGWNSVPLMCFGGRIM